MPKPGARRLGVEDRRGGDVREVQVRAESPDQRLLHVFDVAAAHIADPRSGQLDHHARHVERAREQLRVDADVRNGPAYTGELRSHTVDRGGVRYHVLSLIETAAPKDGAVIADLYEPVLLGSAPLAFRLRGYERLGGDQREIGVVQEWHCELP